MVQKALRIVETDAKMLTDFFEWPAAAGQEFDNLGSGYCSVVQCGTSKLRNVRHCSVWLPQLPQYFKKPVRAPSDWKPSWDDLLEDEFANKGDGFKAIKEAYETQLLDPSPGCSNAGITLLPSHVLGRVR